MYRNLSGMSRADRWRQHRHRRHGPGRRGAPRVVPAQHERRALHVPRTTTTCGPPTSALRSFQETWVANSLARLKADDWDGVLMDDTNPTMFYSYYVDRVPKYPNDAAYQAATGSALAYIGPRLRAAGQPRDPELRLVARDYRDAITPWLKYVSGGMEEHFTKFGDSPARRATSPAATGTTTSPRSSRSRRWASSSSASRTRRSATGRRRATGWATMLLAAEGDATFALHDDYTREAWFPEYDYDLGAPQGQGVRDRRRGAPARVRARPRARQPDQVERCRVRFGGRYRGSGLGTSTGTVDAPPHRPRAAVRLRAGDRAAQAQGPRARRCASASPAAARARPCRRVITVALRGSGRRVVVGRRHVAVRRTARVKVRLSAKGHAALKRGRTTLRVSVRARR